MAAVFLPNATVSTSGSPTATTDSDSSSSIISYGAYAAVNLTAQELTLLCYVLVLVLLGFENRNDRSSNSNFP
ncbi:hypothetical protein D5086_029925 [Populus alba]|uniref:Uncharacterized protein n=1 Tax=Populus alba TaxID=43335 RepID=A0ACC4AMU5_POPAL